MVAAERSSGLRRICSRIVRAWDAVQVELHGCYSVQRMEELGNYVKHTTGCRAWLVIVLTPLPCLLAVAVADCIPLTAPSEGIANSQGFWVRAAFATSVYTYSVLEQLRCFLPSLPLTGWSTLALSVPVMLATNSVTYALATSIGYPLPFTIPVLSLPWSVFMAITLRLYLHKYLRDNPAKAKELLTFFFIAGCQMSMLVIYPAYNAIFYNLSPTAQALMVLFLPLIKLIEKNLLSFFMRQVDDLKPESITFNVEIFSALFVACCMQNSASIITNIELVAIDFLMACISLRDLDQMLTQVHEIATKASISPGQLKEAALLIARQYPRLERRVSERVRQERLDSRRVTLASTHSDRAPKPLRPVADLLRRIKWIGSTSKTHPAAVGDEKSASKDPIMAWTAHADGVLPQQYRMSTRTSSTVLGTASSISVAPFPVLTDESSQANAVRPASVIELMTEEDRLVFLQKALQILHLTEYMLLIEFTEVMIPVVYSLYLVVLFYLPNRAFYPQLKDMDNERLHRTIANVMLNAIFEFLSLILLAAVLRKRLHTSPFRQLAFVLDRQWRMVQSKLVLWVVITLQSTLYHLGADYSFKFEWLQERHPPA